MLCLWLSLTDNFAVSSLRPVTFLLPSNIKWNSQAKYSNDVFVNRTNGDYSDNVRLLNDTPTWAAVLKPAVIVDRSVYAACVINVNHTHKFDYYESDYRVGLSKSDVVYVRQFALSLGRTAVSSNLYNLLLSLLVDLVGRKSYRPKTDISKCDVLVSILLLIAGVESNPGPSARKMQRPILRFGLFNVRSSVKKAASIHTLLAHDDLDVLALTETWSRVDDAEAVKLDIAPSGYAVHHVPRTLISVHVE